MDGFESMNGEPTDAHPSRRGMEESDVNTDIKKITTNLPTYGCLLARSQSTQGRIVGALSLKTIYYSRIKWQALDLPSEFLYSIFKEFPLEIVGNWLWGVRRRLLGLAVTPSCEPGECIVPGKMRAGKVPLRQSKQ